MSIYVGTLAVLLLAVLLGVAVYQLLWTSIHKRNIDRHGEEMKRIYAHHSEEMRRIYDE